jgi:hypothetical protein
MTFPPQPPDGVRPSDDDRQRAAAHLHTAVNEGRLDLDEYERRLRASERAATVAELQSVTADLPPAAPPANERVLLTIGEMSVTPTSVYTPLGRIPLRGSQWAVYDQWAVEQKIPTWAIVLSIVGFFCLTIFSLLFLLVKENRYYGTVDVTVTNGQQQYGSRIPVQSHPQVQHIYQQVNYVRTIAAG